MKITKQELRKKPNRSKRKKLLVRIIKTHLQWDEKDALLIRLVEAVEQLAEQGQQSLELLQSKFIPFPETINKKGGKNVR